MLGVLMGWEICVSDRGEDTGGGEEDASDAEEDEDADTELPDEERPTDPPENDI